ncbi:MAG: glycosyltransferase family 87 protein [Candidatus Thorarchaeota archaeon]
MSWVFLIFAFVIHTGFISSLWTGMLNSLFYDTKFLVGQGADFFSYYQAGHNILNGLDCYLRPEVPVVPYFYPYRYLPYFAYSFGVILNLAPPVLAYWLWIGVLTVSVWFAALRTRTLAKALHRPDWEGRIAMGMWFVYSPIYIELFLGQVTLFAAILLFFALTTPLFVEGQNHGWWSMTIFWVAGSLTKLIPFFIAPVLIGAGKVRSVLVAVIVTVIAVVAVPAGLESLHFFLNFNTARTLYISPYAGNHSLKMLLYYLFGEPSRNFSVVTGFLIGVFFVLAFSATLYSRDVWTCAGLFSITYFFIMTDVWEHHYSFILPFLVLAWIRGRSVDKARWIPITLVLLLSLPAMPIIEFLSGLGPGVHPISWDPVLQILYHSSKVVPALIFYGWLLATAFRSPRADGGLESVSKAFQNAWKRLNRGSTRIIKGGIIVRTELEIAEGFSESSS